MKRSFLSAVLISFLLLIPFLSCQSIASTVYMKIKLDKHSFRYPEPVVLQVYLYGPSPIAGALVNATIISPSGKKRLVLLSEDIVVGNMIPRNGGYACILPGFKEDGSYRILIHANDNNNKAHVAGGFIQDLPNPVQDDQSASQKATKPFQLTGEERVLLSGYAGSKGVAPFPITTLRGDLNKKNCVQLSWITPPNIDPGGYYEVRCSSREITTEKAWGKAKRITRKKYTSKGGESQEQEICSKSKGSFYFAVRSVAKNGIQSETSNNYHIVVK